MYIRDTIGGGPLVNCKDPNPCLYRGWKKNLHANIMQLGTVKYVVWLVYELHFTKAQPQAESRF